MATKRCLMKYTKLFRAIKKDTLPTIEGMSWTVAEKERIEKGYCVQCGCEPSEDNSFICKSCEEKETLDEIKNDIEKIRQQLIQSNCNN